MNKIGGLLTINFRFKIRRFSAHWGSLLPVCGILDTRGLGDKIDAADVIAQALVEIVVESRAENHRNVATQRVGFKLNFPLRS